MVYENCKIGNKYICKDGRVRIYIVFPNKTNSVISYPKYLMEVHLGRYLLPNETIDHIDCNPLNNNIDNLRVLDRKEHIRIDSKRRFNQEFECPICHIKFVLNAKQLSSRIRNARANNISGPFCSRHCSGIFGQLRQMGQIEKLDYAKIQSLSTIKQCHLGEMQTHQI